jgi:hypothetical protein
MWQGGHVELILNTHDFNFIIIIIHCKFLKASPKKNSKEGGWGGDGGKFCYFVRAAGNYLKS